MFTKVYTRILDSSIWLESDSMRLIWMTMIIAMDEDGFVQFASVRNLAHRARVPLEATEEAVNRLESPDPDSSDPEHEGRRIERVPGGWMVLNAGKYRAIATRESQKKGNRERVRRHRARKKAQTPCNGDVTVGNDFVTPSEAEAEAEADVTVPAHAGTPPAGAGPTATDVVEIWNNIVTAPIPKVEKLTASRKRKIDARLKSYPELETWRTCITWLNGQAWCRAPGTGDHPDWAATLDWLIKNDDPMTRTLESVSAEGAARAAPSSSAEPARPTAEAVLAGLRGVIGDEVLGGASVRWRGRTLLLGVGDPPALDSQREAIETCVRAQAPDAVVEVVQGESVR